MSTITCVFWLQSGAKFAEFDEPDWGTGEIGVEFTKPRPVSAREMLHAIRTVDGPDLDTVPPWASPPTLLFTLTEDPQLVAAQYAVGRRRFHYRETSGWKSDDELMEEDIGRGRFSLVRLHEQEREETRKYWALLAAGMFPAATGEKEAAFTVLQKKFYLGGGLILPKHFFLWPPIV